MKYIFFIPLLFLAACNSKTLNTGQDLTVELIGTDSAFCWISTPKNRYELYAPGTVFIERSMDDLKIDCDDNNSDRRRVLTIKPEYDGLFWSFPEKVSVNFAKIDNGSRYNGYRSSDQISSDKTLNSIMSEILTEDSFSSPVMADQTYPVHKDYMMSHRSHPVYVD